MYQNRVSIIGFVGNEAQLWSIKNGAPVAVFSVATKSSWKNAGGGMTPAQIGIAAWPRQCSPSSRPNSRKGSRTSRGPAALPRVRERLRHEEGAAPFKHRVAAILVNRILKLDRAEKQDEPAPPEVDPSELPADQPTG